MINRIVEFVHENKLRVDSVKITIDGASHFHDFSVPVRRNIRSISKVVSCLGVYKAIEEGFFEPESPVMPFFRNVEINNKENLDYLSRLKIRHLLTLSIGHERGLMLRKDYRSMPVDTEYIGYILNSPIKHEPGTFFVYNNAATYLLSAIIQRLSGTCLDDWVYEAVLRHLGIEKPQWEKTSQGICLGATGLHFNNEEVHRIGLLLLNRGQYGGCQIIDGSWVDAMHQANILNPGHEKFNSPGNRCLKKVAYGYHIWVCGDGSNEHPATHYFCDGAEGQFLIVAPEQRMVLTMLSRERNTDMLYGIICDCLTSGIRRDV